MSTDVNDWGTIPVSQTSGYHKCPTCGAENPNPTYHMNDASGPYCNNCLPQPTIDVTAISLGEFWKARAEAAESQLEALRGERDEARKQREDGWITAEVWIEKNPDDPCDSGELLWCNLDGKMDCGMLTGWLLDDETRSDPELVEMLLAAGCKYEEASVVRIHVFFDKGDSGPGGYPAYWWIDDVASATPAPEGKKPW